ncbi:MAG TPA: TVP38/TMEM64 family protein [Pirellulales bacterium]|nr:TVP38/TMEM64 family protein [Pirellulales bacterium]
MNKRLLRRLILAVLATATVATWCYLPQFRGSLRAAVDHATEMGPWGPALLTLLYVPAALLLVPGSWLTVLGGFVFGWWRAAAAVSVGATLGACTSFLVGRYLARDHVERVLAERPRFRAIDRAVAEQGFKILVLCRLSPLLPYALLNYGFGLTRMSLARFALASWLGMLPGTIVYAYLGAATGRFVDTPTDAAPTSAGRLLLVAGIAASITLLVVLTRIATRALRSATNEPTAPAGVERQGEFPPTI